VFIVNKKAVDVSLLVPHDVYIEPSADRRTRPFKRTPWPNCHLRFPPVGNYGHRPDPTTPVCNKYIRRDSKDLLRILKKIFI